jgi:signal transduction histidine kinase
VSELHGVLQTAVTVAFVVLGASALRLWHRTRSTAAGWLALAFGLLGLVVLAGRVLPDDAESGPALLAGRLVVAGLAVFPYALWRFAAALRPTSVLAGRGAFALTAVVVAASLALPDLPGPGEERSPLFTGFVGLFLVQWVLLSGAVVVGLWRAGSRQPAPARRRMRTMAFGAAALVGALFVAATAPSTEEVTAGRVVTQFLALLSGPAFWLGFAPPALVRIAWRREEESQLRAAEAELMTVQTPADVGAVLLPHASRLLGGGSAELYDQRGTLVAAEAGSDDEVAEAEVEIPMSFGHLVVRPSRAAPFFGADEDDLMRGLAVMADLALARADLFDRLVRSNEELQQFAYVASHDLQEPLRTVASYAELLGRRYEGRLDDKADRYIGFMVDGCQRMQDLINDLLQFSRVGSRTGELEVLDIDVALDRALRNLGAAVEASGATITRGDLPHAELDVGQMALVFQNLIGNAIKFGGDSPPKIEIGARRVDQEHEITVRDHGIGIDPQYRERIFTIFQRLHTRSEYPGTGIGLAICKKVVERHGGRIWLDEGSEGGAVFRFTLPVVEAPS